tara:strand:+ start:2063 stop:2956 length:894 start_codon:yes stop_codon:yes gene_type:complete
MSYEPKNLELWKMPPDYFGEHFEDHYVVYSRTRDSDLLNISNFEFIQNELEELQESLANKRIWQCYTIQHASHWAVGWVEIIYVHKNSTEILIKADEIIGNLDDYPVLDEEDYSNRQIEEFESNLESEVKDFIYDHHEEIDFRNSNYFIDEAMDDHTQELLSDISSYISEDLGHGVGYDSENYPDEIDILLAFKFIGIFRNLYVLVLEAEKSCKSRGHNLSDWTEVPSDYFYRKDNPELFNTENLALVEDKYEQEGIEIKQSFSHCLSCNKEVQIIIKPMPNEIDISGQAVALECVS